MNELIIQIFLKLIKINEYLSKTSNDKNFVRTNEFRIRSLKTGLRFIKSLQFEIKTINQIDELKIEGIGKGIKDRIKEIITTKKLTEIDEICKNIDCENLNKTSLKDELLSIIGVGDSLVDKLLSEYKITSVSDFIKLVKSKELSVSKTVELGIKYYKKLKFNIPRQEITKTLDYLLKEFEKIDSSLIIQICGSYRRQKLTSNDIDLLITTPFIINENISEIINLMQKIISHFHKNNFLIDDMTPKPTNKYMGICKYEKFPFRRIDIRFIPLISWFPATLYFTGSKEFNQKMRIIAKKLGYKLNEYGLYKNNKMIYVESEEEIFKLLGMKYLEPHQRNNDF
jgi:DNA polymerase/3'-5' exonuclease PolX